MKAFVLYTIINGRKNFVATQMANRAADNKKIVNYTTDTTLAKDFGSTAAAEAFIQNIVNPHERVFNADVIEVNEKVNAGELVDQDIK